MQRPSRCQSCQRPATRTITGRVPGKTCYSVLSCDRCAPKHRQKAHQTGGPLDEEELEGCEQDRLF